MLKILTQYIKDFDRLRIPRTATQLAFNALFALIPMMALSLQLLLWMPGSNFEAKDILHWLLLSGLPEGMEPLAEELESWIEGLRQLSLPGLVISALSSLFLVMRLNESLSQIWETTVRPLRLFALWFSALSIPIVLSLLLSIFAMAKTLIFMPAIFGNWLDLLNRFIDFGNWISLLLLFSCLILLYGYIPGVKVERRKLILIALATATVITASGQLFILVLEQLPSLQLMTGLISTLPLLLIWVFWVSLLVLSGALSLKYWQSGPLKPLHILTWDQLVRIIESLHHQPTIDWTGSQKIGLTHADWVATMAALVDLNWVKIGKKHQYKITEHAYKQSFDQIWPLVSYNMPKEGDTLHRIFGPLAKMPLERVLEKMEKSSKPVI